MGNSFFSAFPDLNVDMSGDIFNGWISVLVIIKRAFRSPWRYCFSLDFFFGFCTAVHLILQSGCNHDILHFVPQKYLRSFFAALLKSPSSPLHIDKVGSTLSKHTICEFSPFFRKGVFDYSSHGTS